MKNVILAIGFAAVLASCSSVSSTKSKVGSVQPSLAGTSWILADAVKGNSPTLNVDDTKVSGNAGCNNYFGEIALNTTGGSFSAQNLGATKKMCENMSVEKNFMEMVSQANKYVVNGNTLELYKDNLLLLKFTKSE